MWLIFDQTHLEGFAATSNISDDTTWGSLFCRREPARPRPHIDSKYPRVWSSVWVVESSSVSSSFSLRQSEETAWKMNNYQQMQISKIKFMLFFSKIKVKSGYRIILCKSILCNKTYTIKYIYIYFFFVWLEGVHIQWMNGWRMNEWMNEWLNEWMNEWMNGEPQLIN